jgi:electron transport complex protein RnfG
MRKTLQMISVLTVVGLVSGAMLVFMYNYTNPRIVYNQKREIELAVFKIFPEGASYDKVIMEDSVIFSVKDKNGALLGYAFLAEGNGYQGTIKMMAGIKANLKTIVGIEILQSQETPGLGQEITGDEFKSQFKGLMALPKITYVKNKAPERPGEIQAITGATVSSSAICSILNERIKEIREQLKMR